MADYLAERDVKALVNLARSLPPGFLDALATLAELGRGVAALGLEVLSLRQRVQGNEMNLTRYAQTVAAKDTELQIAYAKVEALEKRVATLAAA
jgi:hypothetical protein